MRAPYIPLINDLNSLSISIDDSAAHISEETSGAARAAPIAILVSVAAISIMGWILFIGASLAIPSVPALLSTGLALPIGQLLLDVLGKRGMLAIWSLTIIAQVRRVRNAPLDDPCANSFAFGSSFAERRRASTRRVSFLRSPATTPSQARATGARSTRGRKPQ